MGYYADYDGYIKFKEVPSKETLKNMEYTFGDYYRSEEKMFAVGGHEKYYEDEVLSFLEEIDSLTEDGEIEYTGEDNTHWRWFFKDNAWMEEPGEVYYDSQLPTAQDEKDEFLGRIMDVIQDCLDNPRGEILEGEWYDETIDELTAIMRAWKVFK